MRGCPKPEGLGAQCFCLPSPPPKSHPLARSLFRTTRSRSARLRRRASVKSTPTGSPSSARRSRDLTSRRCASSLGPGTRCGGCSLLPWCLIQVDKRKYLIPMDLTVGQFVYVIRKRISIPPEKAIFIFVNDTLPPTAALMSTVYETHRDKDGFMCAVPRRRRASHAPSHPTDPADVVFHAVRYPCPRSPFQVHDVWWREHLRRARAPRCW